MTLKTVKAVCGAARKRGEMPVASVRNRIIEDKKHKKRYTDAWKKEVRAYA